MGSSNPVNKVKNTVNDAVGSVQDNPLQAARIGAEYLLGAPVIAGVEAARLTGMRARDDQRDQAEGMAQKEQNRASDAEARAIDASVKDLDPITLERRRRAAVATNQGRSGTILTAGTSLGSADVARKTLLGM